MEHTFTPIGDIEVEGEVFWHLAIDREHRLVRLTRTSVSYPELAVIGVVFGRIERALAVIDRKRYRALLDLREAPGRNDRDFEVYVERYRRELNTSFERTASLVRTASGMLQIKRLIREDGRTNAAVFMAESLALRHLERTPNS